MKKEFWQVCTHEFQLISPSNQESELHCAVVYGVSRNPSTEVGYNRVEPGLRDSSTKTDDPDDYWCHIRARSSSTWPPNWDEPRPVAVDGQNRQEDDAAVISRVEHKANCFASRISKSPAIHVVVGPEGQAKGKNQIRESQIQQKCCGEGFQISYLQGPTRPECFPHSWTERWWWKMTGVMAVANWTSIFLDTDVNSHVFIGFIVIIINITVRHVTLIFNHGLDCHLDA